MLNYLTQIIGLDLERKSLKIESKFEKRGRH